MFVYSRHKATQDTNDLITQCLSIYLFFILNSIKYLKPTPRILTETDNSRTDRLMWSQFVGLLRSQFRASVNKHATRVQCPHSHSRWDKNVLLWNSGIAPSTRRAVSSVFTIRLLPPPLRFRIKERTSSNFRTNFFITECLNPYPANVENMVNFW